jgi:hypothetical protein
MLAPREPPRNGSPQNDVAGAALTSLLLMIAAVLGSTVLLSGIADPAGRPDPSPGRPIPHTSP